MAGEVEQQRQMAAERRRIQREEIIEGVGTTTPPFTGSHDDLTDVTAEQHQDLVTLSAEADAVLELAGQELDLDVQAAGTVFAGPATGAAAKPTFVGLSEEHLGAIAEGPDIDLVRAAGVLTIGRAGDSILLFDAGGEVLREYAWTSAGLTAALAAMAAGDVLELCAGTISGGPWTLANGTLRGLSREDSILDGQLTVSDATAMENMSIIRSETEAGALLGVAIGATGTAKVYACNIFIDQNGAGDAYGVYTSGGTLYVYQCTFNVDAAVGDAWCAGGIDDGAIFLVDGLGRATTAPVET